MWLRSRNIKHPYTSEKGTRVKSVNYGNPLLNLVKTPSTPIMESVKQKMDMYLNDETKDVTFTSDEIVAAKNQEYILYIATESDADIYHSAQGKKKAGLPLTPAETEALKKKEPSDTPKVMDAIRFEEEGDLWIVRKSTSSCAREEEMHMSEADHAKIVQLMVQNDFRTRLS